MTTWTPGFARSSQSLMPLGLPLRTRNSIVEYVGDALFGKRFAQSVATTERDARKSMSFAEFIVTTSASRPSATERACLLDPSCDWLIVTSCPLFCFQYFTKAGL